ncbi:MAG TPA: HD-GYP domain-containing protein, partial [Azonexus sp.]|nr:HD-GYP domain-containing protein [Azonexus sp.]
MPHRVTLPTPELQIGMFVSDLDRPWIETPFLLQGFLIETGAEIATLQQYCNSVTVDRSRSLGEAYTPRHNGKDDLRQPAIAPRADESIPNDFVAICRQLHGKPASRRYSAEPILDPNTRQSRLETELLYSAPVVDDLKKTVASVHEALAKLQTISLNEVGDQVATMARGVERNPDAMMWLARLRSTDQYSYDHAVDVSVHLMVFARYLGLPATSIEQIGIAGLMQDIGKIHIPAEILNKTTPLSNEEYTVIQSHVASSLEMLLGQKDFPTSVLEIIASHHERADGSGYPRRLKGERIGFHGELAGLVDTYCAMTRDRAYGSAISSQKALESLIQMRGTKFREPVVDQFIQCIGLYPIGSLVELNTGEVA